MRVNGFKWKCKIGPDGRLGEGAWFSERIIPRDLPADELLFEEFPDTTNGGADYVWDGKELHYVPLPPEEKASPAPGDLPPDSEEVMTYA